MECIECVEDMYQLAPRYNVKKHLPVLIGKQPPVADPGFLTDGDGWDKHFSM